MNSIQLPYNIVNGEELRFPSYITSSNGKLYLGKIFVGTVNKLKIVPEEGYNFIRHYDLGERNYRTRN